MCMLLFTLSAALAADCLAPSPAVIEYAITISDAPEIETYGGIAKRVECFGKGLHHLVVKRPPM